ncbi:SusC/RagA family TonB-linked outer membrane protein [Reichenbachiella ulvae]|uniref:TonB-dependent receptor n=1 Tax=Reichenbachiella ulvae TaxID=2980104 RepID=A0ABT3CP74_9BACT|nr:TonB-dependent receptor [Reichenbachiella ulvae]MCV9385078.1 TonB-dependent receptor [Reichenbachiella ulvae]
MKSFTKSFYLCLLMILVSTSIFAQGSSITGRVVDAEMGDALPGATVLEKGTSNGTVSDIDGNYSITVSGPDAVLVVSFVGYLSQEIAVGSRSTVDIKLNADVASLEEVVVIGYGTKKKSDVTTSIATADPEIVTKNASNDVRNALKGQVAGVSIQGGGEPGNEPQVKIRGTASFGNNNPLYIVDGIQTPISQVPSQDIESIQVLKDGAANAIYGSRGANGVIIITTKRGKKGGLQVNYNAYYGVQNVTRLYDVTNAAEYQELNNEAVTAAMPYNSELVLVPTNDPNSPDYVTDIDTDWQKEGYKQGKIQEHNISLSGGNENSNFYLGLNYFDQTGTAVGNGPNYERLSLRINSDHNLGSKLKIGQSLQIGNEDRDFAAFLKDGNWVQDLTRAIPTMPIYDENMLNGYGGPDGVLHRSLTNNIIGINSVLVNKGTRIRTVGNLYLEYEIIKGLKFKTSVSGERTDWRDTREQPVYDFGTTFNDPDGEFFDWRGTAYLTTIDNTLTYANVFGKHRVNALIGNTVLNGKSITLNAHAVVIDPLTPTVINNAQQYNVSGGEQQNRLTSLFGRLQYDFANKYFIEGSIRRDGSSRFGENIRYGVFPAVSGGWKISEESFMQSLTFLDLLKLRASYGETGNQEFANYNYSTYVNSNAHAVFGGQLAFGATQLRFGNPDLKWETVITRNFGVDMAMFNNKFTFSAEYYEKESEDLLLQLPVPNNTGLYPWETPWVNAGGIKNSGLEFVAGISDTKGDFSYSVNANFSTLKNEVVSLGNGEPIHGNTSITEEGAEIGRFYGYKIEGMFQTQEEVDALNAGAPDGLYQEPNTAAGDFIFADVNGDGEITQDDRVYLGSAIPKYYYGGSITAGYKNFDFNLNWHGHAGNKVLDMVRVSLENGAGYANYDRALLDRWQQEGDQTDIPRMVIGDPNGNGRASDRWLENGSFVRISSIQLGYSLPESIISRARISKFRIYGSVLNPVVFTKYQGTDPEFGNDGLFNRGIAMSDAPNKAFNSFTGGFPTPRTFMLGVQVQF